MMGVIFDPFFKQLDIDSTSLHLFKDIRSLSVLKVYRFVGLGTIGVRRALSILKSISVRGRMVG